MRCRLSWPIYTWNPNDLLVFLKKSLVLEGSTRPPEKIEVKWVPSLPSLGASPSPAMQAMEDWAKIPSWYKVQLLATLWENPATFVKL